jgi:hypothetical protein
MKENRKFASKWIELWKKHRLVTPVIFFLYDESTHEDIENLLIFRFLLVTAYRKCDFTMNSKQKAKAIKNHAEYWIRSRKALKVENVLFEGWCRHDVYKNSCWIRLYERRYLKRYLILFCKKNVLIKILTLRILFCWTAFFSFFISFYNLSKFVFKKYLQI